MSRTALFDKPSCESSRLLCGVFCTCLDHSYVDITVAYKRRCTGSFLKLITTVIVAYMAYTRVVCASMHVLFPVRKFLLCAIAFAPGKLRVILKIADQSPAGSHFNSQNTHSQFRNSHFTLAPMILQSLLLSAILTLARILILTTTRDSKQKIALGICNCPSTGSENIIYADYKSLQSFS